MGWGGGGGGAEGIANKVFINLKNKKVVSTNSVLPQLHSKRSFALSCD